VQPLCQAGHIPGQGLLQECVACEVGHYADRAGMAECLPCPVGFYSAQSGASECTPIPEGAYASGEGQATYELCPVGTYSDCLSATSNLACTRCPYSFVTQYAGSTHVSDCYFSPIALLLQYWHRLHGNAKPLLV
jgi:hypothetical protein